MASFYRRWISDFACMVAPLTDMFQLVDDPKGTVDPKTKKVRKVEKDLGVNRVCDFCGAWDPECALFACNGCE